MNENLRGRALAHQDKERALEALEIELDSQEAEPFARGSQGAVHKASYQGEVVALKKMSLVGITATKRNKMMKDFSTELAIMVKLRSPRIVSVYGVVTTDSSWLGLVVEYCAGGDLREALDADDYATSVDEKQRRSWRWRWRRWSWRWRWWRWSWRWRWRRWSWRWRWRRL